MRNIVARWRGSGPPGKKALLLSAHYDSVARGPGAGDDASGVAAILESLRALKAGPAPDRDVIILINEGEEIGLFGADVFSKEHPWARDVGVVLNLDARGNSGPSYMFETSKGNGWLIEQLARALPHPMATSLTVDVYRLMPNDTDLTIYTQHDMPGLNFAFIGGLSYYHSPEDTPANLDPRTLQHQGENLLAMARHLVRLDLDDVRRDDVVYVSVLQQFVAIYPTTWVVPLMGFAVLAYLAVMALGLLKRRVRFAEIVAGFLTFLAVLIVVVCVVSLIWIGMSAALGVRRDLLFRYDQLLLTGFSAVAILIGGVIFTWASLTVVLGGARPGGAGLVAGGDGGDIPLADRRELRVRLALVGVAGRPVRELRGSPRRDDRRPGVLAGGRSALARFPDDPARILRRLESADGGPADDPGLAGRRRAGASDLSGRGLPTPARCKGSTAQVAQPGHPWNVGGRPMPW